MKKLFGAIVIGTLVFGAVVASAANLGVNGNVIQVGSDSVLTCDPDGVGVQWNTRQDGVVTSVQVTDVESTCDGQNMYVYVLDGGGNIIAAGGELSSSTGGAPLTFIGTPLFAPDLYNAPCDSTSCKVQLGTTNNDLYPYGAVQGVGGQYIEGVRIVIGV
jgi:hypothetical protein